MIDRTPINRILDEFDWVPVEAPADVGESDDLPWVTHEGLFDLMGLELRCYQLSDGSRVFDSGDIRPFLAALGIAEREEES